MKPVYDGYHGNSLLLTILAGRWLFYARLVQLEPGMVAIIKRWLPVQRNLFVIGTVHMLVHLFSMCGGWWLPGDCTSVVRTLAVQARGPEYNSQQLPMTTEAFSRNVSNVISQTQVDIRQPSSFMQEPTEKPLKA